MNDFGFLLIVWLVVVISLLGEPSTAQLTVRSRRFGIPVAHKDTPFRVVNSLSFNNSIGLDTPVQSPYVTLIDTTARFLYVASSDEEEDITLVKFNLNDFSPVQSKVIPFQGASTGVIDSQAGVGWIVTNNFDSNPVYEDIPKSHVIKFRLSDLEVVDNLTLPVPSFSFVMDSTTGMGYIGEEWMPPSEDNPARYKNGTFIKVNLRSEPMVIAKVIQTTEAPDPPSFSSAVIDTEIGAVFFVHSNPGRYSHDTCYYEGICFCSPAFFPSFKYSFCPPAFNSTPYVYKVSLDEFEVEDKLDAKVYGLRHTIVDTVTHMAYVGSLLEPEGYVMKLDLLNFEVANNISVPSMRIQTGMMDTTAGFAFFGTFQLISENYILRINLTDFTYLDRLTIPNSLGQAVVGGVIDTTEGMAYFTHYSQSPVGTLRKYQVADIDCRYKNCMTCASEDDTCQPCPLTAPILCPSGHCSESLSLCPPIKECSHPTPFLCANGQCTNVPSACPNKTATCPASHPVLCWDGACKGSVKECTTVPACTHQAPIRCPNGACVSDTMNCNGTPRCSNGLVLCEDGYCRNECPNYNGCGLDKPVMCASGECAALISDCLCANNMVRCIDGTCKPSGACAEPLFAHQVDPTAFSLLTSDDFNTNIYDSDRSSVLGGVSVPANAFVDAPNNETVLTVESVPHSYIRSIDNNDQYVIGSSIIRLRVEDIIPQPFDQPISITFQVNQAQANFCVAFINETTNQWECLPEDQLTDNGDGSITAITRHFTDFAVLLSGVVMEDPSEDDKQEEEDGDDLTSSVEMWMIYTVIAGVAVIVVVVVSIVILRDQAKRRHTSVKSMLFRKSKGAADVNEVFESADSAEYADVHAVASGKPNSTV